MYCSQIELPIDTRMYTHTNMWTCGCGHCLCTNWKIAARQFFIVKLQQQQQQQQHNIKWWPRIGHFPLAIVFNNASNNVSIQWFITVYAQCDQITKKKPPSLPSSRHPPLPLHKQVNHGNVHSSPHSVIHSIKWKFYIGHRLANANVGNV